MKMTLAVGVLGLAALCGPAMAADTPGFDAKVAALTHHWDHANFEVRDKDLKATEAAKVAAEADAVARQHPNRAEPLVWEALAESTEAGAKGGVGALGLVKDARRLLERAEALDPAALGDGSVYTSLGSLYAQVPGFPLGFGDAKKARAYLTKALAANPTGADPNFFYADFLFRQGDYAGSERALQRALSAPPRPGREVADQGRRADIIAALARTRDKLKP